MKTKNYRIMGGSIYVDSYFINNCQDILPNSELKHLGFGEFCLHSPEGIVHFDRVAGVPFSGQHGRSHRIYDNAESKLIMLLIQGWRYKYGLSNYIGELNIGDYTCQDGDYFKVKECIHGTKQYYLLDIDDIPDFVMIYNVVDTDICMCNLCL